jgi:hypothetical protein
MTALGDRPDGANRTIRSRFELTGRNYIVTGGAMGSRCASTSCVNPRVGSGVLTSLRSRICHHSGYMRDGRQCGRD